MRRLFRRALGVAGLGGLLLLVGLGYCYRDEDVVTAHPTYAAAAAAGLVQSGYLPPYVPASARDLRAVLDLDTNAQWLRFQAPERDLREMVASLQPQSYAAVRRHRTYPSRWRGPWPTEVSGRTIATPRDTSLLGFFTAPGLHLRCVAIEWQTGTAYAWSC